MVARLKPLIVISLGWGVQSFALSAMSALGILPKVDYAIHADTTHERQETYAFAARYTPWLEERGIKVVMMKAKSERLNPFYSPKKTSTYLPAYTTWPNGIPSGALVRQCTDEWKRVPIRRYLQAHRNGASVEQWIGITLDESPRMRNSDIKYITNRYPFIQDFSPPMRRWQVVKWLQDNNLEVPVKSSCVFCPYHDKATWREIKMSGNGDWEKALEVDRIIRHKRPNYVCYLTRHLKPLDEIDFESQQDKGQLELWDEECTGYCFL
jgi:hypothetical protein